MSEIRNLNPECIWRNFDALTQVPRPSGHLEKVQQFLLDFAAKAGVEANTANQATIADLRRVNADWAKKCTFDPAASGEAANKAAENRDALPRDDQRRQEERETMIYDRDQTAAEWGRTSVPAAVADRLRR